MTRRPARPPAATTPRRRALVSLLALGAAAAGCGGGGDELAGVGSGGTGQVAGTGSGGTGQPAGTVAIGPISGFGSVIVNGIKYDDSAATVSDDLGRTRRLGELGLGMVVEVEGAVDALAGTGTARAIRIVGQLAGPVASVDAPAGRFVALGVVVETDASTVWSTTDGIASLGAGGPVEAWGFLDAAAGVLRASRVDARGDVEGLAWLRGQASGYDRAAARVIVGGQLVDLRAAGALPERIDDGTEVRVAGTAGAPGQPLRATRLEVVRSRLPDDVAEARVEGAVSRFESPARFAVTGLDVDASGATVTGGTADALRNGARVRVLGSVSGGAIVARVVEIRGPARGNAGGTNRPDGAGDGGAGGSADGSGTPDASAGSNGGNGNGNGNASAARAAEDPAQVRGSIVSAADPSAIVIRDGHGREFVVDASAGRIIGGTAADLAPGVAVVATGLRATVLRAATIRIER